MLITMSTAAAAAAEKGGDNMPSSFFSCMSVLSSSFHCHCGKNYFVLCCGKADIFLKKGLRMEFGGRGDVSN